MSRAGRDHNPPEHSDALPRHPTADRSVDDQPSPQDGRGGSAYNQQSREKQANDRPAQTQGPAPQRNHYRDVDRERSYNLRDSEIATLADIGTFRALAVEDLTRYRYAGDAERTRRELDNMARQGLIRVRTTHPEGRVFVALSRQGHEFIQKHQPDDLARDPAPHTGNGNQRRSDSDDKSPHPGIRKQVLYHGFVKPREAKHDAALYRLYQQEAGRIAQDGGQVNRVVLDFELKKSINRELVKLQGLPADEQLRRKQEIAQAHGLTVVDGKIPIPDLRLEYEDRDHQQTKVDLELATAHYHRDTLAEKARAGFAVFREQSQRGRGSADDHELLKDVLSL